MQRVISCSGGAGQEYGQFEHITGIVIDAEGNIYVADYEASRIQKFTPNGEFITQWRASRPDGITMDAAGRVYVTDDQNNRVQKFEILWP